MLQGTLDVFSLDEVLGLLSGANKSGVLNITGDRGVGTISITDGQLVAGSASSAPSATELSDVVFELLRFEEGSFSFDGNALTEGEPSDLEQVLTEAHARLGEWRDIESVVPTLDHHLSLVDSLATSQVTLNESEWSTIVAIGEGATVGVVAQRLELGEFDGSKRVKGLVERNLVSIRSSAHGLDPVEAPAAEVAPAETSTFETAVVTAAPVFETEAPAPTSLDLPTVDGAPTSDDVAVSETESLVADAPAFTEHADEIPPMPEAPVASFDAPMTAEQEELPPMPQAPVASFDAPDADEIPPMPEPPRPFGDEASLAEEFAAPIEAETVDAIPASSDDAPSAFGGLDPIGSVDMFEPPRRTVDEGHDGFAVADDVPPAPPAPESAPVSDMPPPPAPEANDGLPSFAPPAFDPDDFAVNDDAVDTAVDTADDPFAPPPGAVFGAPPAKAATEVDDNGDDSPAPEKGGSLLMRYLKSNG